MSDSVQLLKLWHLEERGIKHGWFTRHGGVSSGKFASLNGKKDNGDLEENVTTNRQRALQALTQEGAEDYSPRYAVSHIIHSFETNVLEATEPGEFTGYDAIFTLQPGIVLSQTTADCGTIVIAAKDGSAVSLVHGSWHTLRDKIICKTVAKLKEHTESELIAGIGPMICHDCYEFGAEAANIFAEQYRIASGEKYHVDLKQMIIDQLNESGISEIEDVNICTKEDQRYFSHRRSGAHSGRFLTLAALSI